MKAMILAAGEGTRLRPLTQSKPKPMLSIAGAPILEHNVRLLAAHGVRDIIINLHHCPDAITGYFGDGSRFNVRIQYSYEEQLLGTAGALKRVAHLFEEDFFLVYGDNLTTCNLSALLQLHKARSAALTMALFERDDPRASGIVGVDDNGRITRFLEKPRADQIFSHWVNAGYLVLHPSVLDLIPPQGVSDFGRDVFEPLIELRKPVYGYRMSEGLWWIDSLADYERTNNVLDQKMLTLRKDYE